MPEGLRSAIAKLARIIELGYIANLGPDELIILEEVMDDLETTAAMYDDDELASQTA